MTRIFKPAFIIILFLMFLFFPSLLFADSSGNDNFYDSPGLDPNRATEGVVDFEHIDPYTGGLTLNFVDMRLPGNGGLDLVIQRTYNSKNACRGWTETTGGGETILSCLSTDIDQGGSSWVGMGWSLHMGKVTELSNPRKFIIEVPDGSQHAAYLKTGEANKYITKDYWILDASTASSYTLTFTDGKKMTFGQNYGGNVYYATKIEDTNGDAITITYNTYSSGHGSEYEGTIKSITDSASRTTSFTLTSSKIGGRYRLSKITRPDNNTITFSYTEKSSGLSAILDKVTPPVGNSWSFSYGTNIYELTKITTPYGGSLEYTYETKGFNYSVSGSQCTKNFRTVSKKTTSGVTNTGTWNFYYFEGTYKNETRITDPCSRTIKYKHYGYNSSLTNNEMWKLGLPISKEIAGQETINYEWTKSSSYTSYDDFVGATCGSNSIKDDYIYVPYLSSQSITRDSKTYSTSYSNFDSYGNPKTISESGDKTRTTTREYWYNTSKNIVHDKPSSETISGGFSGSFTTNYTYDTNTGNLTQLKKYGVTTDYTYYSNGNLYTMTDANSNKTTYVWSNGRISKITNPVYSISRSINSIGTIASETDGRNNTTSFDYDGNLRLKSIDPPAGNTTYFTYPSDNSYKKEARGSFYTYYYFDGLGRPSGTKDSIGVTTDIVYKSCGLKDYTDSNIGDKTSFDNFGRVTKILHKDGKYITYSYSDSTENKVTVTDEATNNNEATYKTYLYYNAFGNPDEKWLVKVTDAKSNDTTYDYNILGSTTSITQGSVTRSFSYNSNNFLTSETHPEKGTITYTQYNLGNLKTKKDSLGTTYYYYDGLNRLTTISYGSNTIKFGYDNADNMKSMSNPSASIDYTYDAANRLTQKSETISSKTYTTTYGYDGNDNITSIGYPSGTIATYAYNSNNQVMSITDFGGSITSVSYCTTGTCIGLPSSFISPDGLTTNISYSNRNLTTQTKVGTSTTSTLNTAYDYDSRGNTKTITDYLDSTKNQSLDYDSLSRLTTFNATGLWGTGSFEYDSPGNRKTKKVASDTTTYNYSSNRLTSTTGGEPFSFGYNGDGDVTSIDGSTLTYDSLHNLTSYNGASFAYDGDGMRVSKTANGSTIVYHYDLQGRVISENDDSGNLLSDYIYLNGMLAAKIVNALDLTVSRSGTGSGTVTSTDGGINCGSDCSEAFNSGTTVTLTATANTGSTFTGWSGDCTGTSSSCTVTMNAAKNVTAAFTLNTYTITASVVGSGGSISPSGSVTVNYNSNQTFTITPNSGYKVSDVKVDSVSKGAISTYTFSNVTADHTISASFSIAYTLTVSKSGTGSGTVTSTDGGINCGSDCSETFSSGTTVTLTATADSSSTFGGWSGDCTGTSSSCTVTMTAAKSVTATFTLKTYTISASAGSGGSISPSGTVTVNHGSSQTFTMKPSAGYHVEKLTVDSASVEATTTYTFSNVTAGHTISASFSNISTLTVSRSGTGTGTVTGTGISCGSDCSEVYSHGTTVTLTATPDINSTFSGWSGGGCSGTETSCTVTMDSSKTVTATFTMKTYTITASAGSGGSISPSGTVTVNYGNSQTFTITTDEGYHVEDVTVDNVSKGGITTYTFSNVTADHTISASFSINTGMREKKCM